jgi:BirA family biotin operon repressor/biotin-[acetyl-CoA-carboxylase] ligase
MLLETAGAPGPRLDWLVLGVGLNLTAHPETGTSYPATSLAAAGGRPVEPGPALEEVAERFALWRERWRRDGFAPVRTRWLERAWGLGGSIEVRLERETLSGRFLGIDETGALLLEEPGGAVRSLVAGETSIPVPA